MGGQGSKSDPAPVTAPVSDITPAQREPTAIRVSSRRTGDDHGQRQDAAVGCPQFYEVTIKPVAEQTPSGNVVNVQTVPARVPVSIRRTK